MKEPAGREIVERYMRAIPGDFDALRELHHPEPERRHGTILSSQWL